GGLVRAEFAEERHAPGADDHAVRVRPWCWRRRELHLARLRIQTGDHVGALQREPEGSLLVEDRCVRIARRRIGCRILDYLARLRIELADISLEVSGEPDVAV